MPRTLPIGLAGGSYSGQSLSFQNDRTINWYPTINTSENPTFPKLLCPTPGLDVVIDLTAVIPGVGGCRGIFRAFGAVLAAFGTNLVYLNSGGTISASPIANDNLPIHGAASAFNALYMFTSAGKGYYGFAVVEIPIPDPDFPASVLNCGYTDHYFFTITSSRLYISALDDPAVWDALDYTTFDAGPLGLNSCVVLDREIWLFGYAASAVYYNSGNANFPFEVRPSGVLDYGNAAPNSPAVIDGRVFWLGVDKNGGYHVVQGGREAGYRAMRISNEAMEAEFKTYPNTDSSLYSSVGDAIGWTEENFYHLVFPSANNGKGKEFVYDIINRLWHERAYYNPITGQYERPRAIFHAVGVNNDQLSAKHQLVGDRDTQIIYNYNPATYTDNGEPIRRLRRAPFAYKPGRGGDAQTKHYFLRVYIQPGVGLAVADTVAGYDPKLMMRYSDDNGNTWSTPIQMDMGKLGEYSTVTEARQLGSTGGERQYEIYTTEPVPAYIMEGFVGVD